MNASTPSQIWPPKRVRTDENDAPSPVAQSPSIRSRVVQEPPAKRARLSSIQPDSSFAETPRPSIKKRLYRSGYETKAKTPSYTPYANPNSTRRKPFVFTGYESIIPKDSLSSADWNKLAVKAGILREHEQLKEFQVNGANAVIERKRDLCVIAPTGAGKSMLWVLPLLAQKNAISLVIIPFTSLGYQGETRHEGTKITATFLHSGSNSVAILERIARGGEKHVVYVCPEMLETPVVAQVLYADSFLAQLSAVYLDEAHVLRLSLSWRPSYGNLHLLRKITTTRIPLVAISATLPSPYRQALEDFAGLRNDYLLINLGNFRPELSTIVRPMQHAGTSFLDLAFVVPVGATAQSIPTTIIYADDLPLLTEMFWWFRTRLLSMSLPEYLVDVLHAGLTDVHQKECTDGFMSGRTKILLGSDKIGAGMDFPHVTLVVQYKCRGITLVHWEQRRGRGARRKGMTATGVLLVEKSMTGTEKDSPTIANPRGEDAGIVELAQSDRCHEVVVDKQNENPLREHHRPCGRCSNCNPHLSITPQLVWVMEDIAARNATAAGQKPSQQKQDDLYGQLVEWRMELWKREWKDQWPSYGPGNLVTDHDLREITQRAHTILTIGDLDSICQIPHFEAIAPSLLTAIRTKLSELCGSDALATDATPSEDGHAPPTFESIEWASPENPAAEFGEEEVNAGNPEGAEISVQVGHRGRGRGRGSARGRGRARGRGGSNSLAQGEFILNL